MTTTGSVAATTASPVDERLALEQVLRRASVLASRLDEFDLAERILSLLEIATENRRRRERQASPVSVRVVR
jgi:hypothetical protein